VEWQCPDWYTIYEMLKNVIFSLLYHPGFIIRLVEGLQVPTYMSVSAAAAVEAIGQVGQSNLS
jgi:hypothetical protein